MACLDPSKPRIAPSDQALSCPPRSKSLISCNLFSARIPVDLTPFCLLSTYLILFVFSSLAAFGVSFQSSLFILSSCSLLVVFHLALCERLVLPPWRLARRFVRRFVRLVCHAPWWLVPLRRSLIRDMSRSLEMHGVRIDVMFWVFVCCFDGNQYRGVRPSFLGKKQNKH